MARLLDDISRRARYMYSVYLFIFSSVATPEYNIVESEKDSVTDTHPRDASLPYCSLLAVKENI